MTDMPEGLHRGIDRRAMIRRSIVAGAAAWTAPMIVDSLTSPAAAGSADAPACCTITSGPIVYNDFNAVAAGNVLWLGAVFKLVGAQTTPVTVRVTTTSLTLTNSSPAFSADLTSTVPVGTVTMGSSNTCSGGATFSSGGGWTTNGQKGCSGNMMMTAVQFVAPTGGIPAHTDTSWTIKVEVLTPGTQLKMNWQYFTRAFSVTPLAYNLTGANPGDDNVFGADQAAYPENYKAGAIAGGSNGSLSSTNAINCPCP